MRHSRRLSVWTREANPVAIAVGLTWVALIIFSAVFIVDSLLSYVWTP